jgi:DNA-binding CsgD family transcriptional regulator
MKSPRLIKIICGVVFLLLHFSARSQGNWRKELEHIPGKYDRIIWLRKEASKIKEKDREKSLEMIQQAMKLAQELNIDTVRADISHVLGSYYLGIGDTKNAWLWLQKAKVLYIRHQVYNKVSRIIYQQCIVLVTESVQGDSLNRFIGQNRFLVSLSTDPKWKSYIQLMDANGYFILHKTPEALDAYRQLLGMSIDACDTPLIISVYSNLALLQENFDSASLLYHKGLAYCVKTNNWHINNAHSTLLYYFATLFVKRDDLLHDSALYYYVETEKLLDYMEPIYKLELYNGLYEFFSKKNEPEIALKYLRLGNQLARMDKNKGHLTLQNMVTTFIKMRELDSAYHYLILAKKAIDEPLESTIKRRYYETAAFYYAAKEDSGSFNALVNYNEALNIAMANKVEGQLNDVNSDLTQALKFLLCQPKQNGAVRKMASNILQHCDRYYKQAKTSSTLIWYTEFLKKYSQAEYQYGNEQHAFKLNDELTEVLMEMNERDYKKGLDEAIVKYKSDLKDQEIAYSKKVNLFLAGGAGLLIMIGLLLYNRKRLKYKQKEALFIAQKQKAEQELHLLTRNILDKNDLIDTLEKEMKGSTDISSLQKHTILTNQQWDDFRKLFEKVHSGYLQRLKEKLPDLSPAETRFMTLAKLNFSSKQMADTLGIGTDAVRMMRYRLRKKLHLTEEGSLEELIVNI